MAPLIDLESSVVGIWSPVLIGSIAAFCFISSIVVCACCKDAHQKNRKSLRHTELGPSLSDTHTDKIKKNVETSKKSVEVPPPPPPPPPKPRHHKEKRKRHRTGVNVTKERKVAIEGAEKEKTAEKAKTVETKAASEKKKYHVVATSTPHYYDPLFDSGKSAKPPAPVPAPIPEVVRLKPVGTVDRRCPYYKTMYGADYNFDPTKRATNSSEDLTSPSPTKNPRKNLVSPAKTKKPKRKKKSTDELIPKAVPEAGVARSHLVGAAQ